MKKKGLFMMLVAMFVAFISCSNVSALSDTPTPYLYESADLRIPFSVKSTTTVAINGEKNRKIKEIVVATNHISGSYKLELLNNNEFASSTLSSYSHSTSVTFRSQDGSCHGNTPCVTVSYAMPGTGNTYISNNAANAGIRFVKSNWLGSLELIGTIYVFYA